MNKKWLDNAITWRSYLKMVSICTIVGTIVPTIYYLRHVGITIGDIAESIKDLFKSN